MHADNEKRYYKRNNVNSSILFANYMTDNYFAGKMRNCSIDGMYFETNNPILPEEDICIKKVRLDGDGSVGQVCRQLAVPAVETGVAGQCGQ